ncbi:hypothetical protein HK101_000630, partial [Irineochytrium annulatum]
MGLRRPLLLLALPALAYAWPNPPAGQPCPGAVVGRTAVTVSSQNGRTVYFGGAVCWAELDVTEDSNMLCELPATGGAVTALANNANDASYIPPKTSNHCCAFDSLTNRMLCMGGTSFSTSLYQYDVIHGIWLTPVPGPYGYEGRERFGCGAVNGIFYAWGGLSSSGRELNDGLLQYSPAGWTVTPIPATVTPRHGHSLVPFNGTLLSLFGTSVTSHSPNPFTPLLLLPPSTWLPIPTTNLPAIGDGASCASHADSGGVFCFGGLALPDGSGYNADLIYLDALTLTWSFLGSPPGCPAYTWGSAVSTIDSDGVVAICGGGSVPTAAYGTGKSSACGAPFLGYYGVPSSGRPPIVSPPYGSGSGSGGGGVPVPVTGGGSSGGGSSGGGGGSGGG